MNTDDEITGIRRLPMNVCEYENDFWRIKLTKSHILSSKCTGKENPECSGEESDNWCKFCFFTRKLSLPHLPDMVFANNILLLSNKRANFQLELNSLDALALVSNGKLSIEVACSEEWKECRQETGHTERVLKPFDWTFSTDYRGTLKGEGQVLESDEKVNLERLKKKEIIHFFDEITLFEDELHDNGVAQLSVKVRVMSEVLYILMRYFLRVDNVLIKINDTRFYHEYDKNYIIREYTSREAKIPDLKIPPNFLLDPNVAAPHLPLLKTINEKIILSK